MECTFLHEKGMFLDGGGMQEGKIQVKKRFKALGKHM